MFSPMHQTWNACLAIIYQAMSIVELSALKRFIPFRDIHLSSHIWEHPWVLHCTKHLSASIHVGKCGKPKLSEAQTMWICLCNHPWKSHKPSKQLNLDSGFRIQLIPVSSMHIMRIALFAHRYMHISIGINWPTMFKYHQLTTFEIHVYQCNA